jgi:hypothetical protein
METPDQAECMRRRNAQNMAEKQKMDTAEEENYRKEQDAQRHRLGGMTLENEFSNEDEEDENVPLISQSIEVEHSTKRAFEHLMKTKVGPDEKIPDELLEKINASLSSYETEKSIQIPIYDQLHQANVCVMCDRFITGTAELFWIHKSTLLQHKSRLQISIIIGNNVTKLMMMTYMDYCYHQGPE